MDFKREREDARRGMTIGEREMKVGGGGGGGGGKHETERQRENEWNATVIRNRKVNETYLEVEVCLTFYRPRAPTKAK